VELSIQAPRMQHHAIGFLLMLISACPVSQDRNIQAQKAIEHGNRWEKKEIAY